MPVTAPDVVAADPWWLPTVTDEAGADDRWWTERWDHNDTEPDDD